MKVTNLFTQEDREVFDRIDRDCLAMHVVPPPKTFLKLEVRDGAGELTDVYEDRAHSWVRNGYNIMAYRSCLGVEYSGFGAGILTLKRINGTASVGNVVDAMIAIGNSGQPVDGIVVGTGTDAESFDSFAMGALVGNGSSAGQLAYSAGTLTKAYDSGTKKWAFTLSRVFNNNSGSSIVVGEVGIGVAASGVSTLTCRDVLTEAKTVPNAGQLTVTYTIEMTFPA